MDVSMDSWHWRMFAGFFVLEPGERINLCQYFWAVMFLLFLYHPFKWFLTSRRWILMPWWVALVAILYFTSVPSFFGELQIGIDPFATTLFLVLGFLLFGLLIPVAHFALDDEYGLEGPGTRSLVLFLMFMVGLPILFLNNVIFRYLWQDFLWMMGAVVLGSLMAKPGKRFWDWIEEKSEELGEFGPTKKEAIEKKPGALGEFWKIILAYLKAKKEKVCPFIELME